MAVKPAAAPFKQWAAEVIATVHQDGSYSLEEAEVQPTDPGAPTAYIVPDQVTEAVVRLEAHNLELDEELKGGQRESIRLQKKMLATQKEMLATQKAMLRALERIADRFDALVLGLPALSGNHVPPTIQAVLADWRRRVPETGDVWTVAVAVVPVLVEQDQLREPLESSAGRTGLTVHRVDECLRLLRKHACIRSRGGTEDGAPVYVLNRP